jgi:hypothetical protein
MQSLIFNEYDYTTNSGTQNLTKHNKVRIASDFTGGAATEGLYIYLGEDAEIDLGSEDYTNKDNWRRFTAESVSELIPAVGNVTDSDSQAFGGIVVRNDLRSGVDSYINNAVVSSGKIDLAADESATIIAFDSSDDHSAGGNENSIYTYMGSESQVDLTNADYTNLDFWKEDLATQLIPQGLNVSDSDSKAYGGMVVRNDVRSNVLSYIDKAILSTSALTVTSHQTATIKSTVDATVTSSGGSSFGTGVIASNMVSSTADAYISSVDNTIDVSGAITISSIDDASIVSTNLMKAISITKNDGGASLAKDLYSSLLDGYKYTSHSGEQAIRSGDIVRVASDHDAGGVKNAVYKYKGERYSTLSDYYQDEGTIIDLSKENFSDDSKSIALR